MDRRTVLAITLCFLIYMGWKSSTSSRACRTPSKRLLTEQPVQSASTPPQGLTAPSANQGQSRRRKPSHHAAETFRWGLERVMPSRRLLEVFRRLETQELSFGSLFLKPAPSIFSRSLMKAARLISHSMIPPMPIFRRFRVQSIGPPPAGLNGLTKTRTSNSRAYLPRTMSKITSQLRLNCRVQERQASELCFLSVNLPPLR